MSGRICGWAWEQKVGSLAEKCVLVALAQYADSDSGECWPSLAAVAEKTESNKKTVLKCISALRKKGLIEDTGERRGRTKSVIVYRLKHTQNRSISKIGAYPNLDTSIPNSGHGKHTQNRIPELFSTEPVNEPISTPLPLEHANGAAPANASAASVKKRSSSKPEEPSEDFLTFWQLYPRKQAMKDAWRAWRKRDPPLDVVLESLRKQKKHPSWYPKSPYVPMPASWINGERWDDEL